MLTATIEAAVIEITFAATSDLASVEIILIDAVLIDDGGRDWDARTVRSAADAWLDGNGYGAACDRAEASA